MLLQEIEEVKLPLNRSATLVDDPAELGLDAAESGKELLKDEETQAAALLCDRDSFLQALLSLLNHLFGVTVIYVVVTRFLTLAGVDFKESQDDG